MDAQRFQQHQTEQGWPVRIIITSRVTLIDKAAVPAGATIVRLLEFDEDQRSRWSAIWNSANTVYFREAKIKKFALPSAKDKGAEKILNLAEQPLLLLMLALYDSQGNQLATSKGLDRTKLYDSLLRRFVTRERGKEKGFSDVKAKEREEALSLEMRRLGVAALGMYNRRKVHILSTELDVDLAFFQLEREVVARSGKTLSQADLLLGSFFFVHKSKAQHSSGAEDTHEESSAFEFLHNTFGEFLTADFIVRHAVDQVEALRAAEANNALRSMRDKMMVTADGFDKAWFASLVYTPLFTRPVILEMIREWVPHVLKDYSLPEDGFVETLEKIVLNQIERILSKREMPQIMWKETAQEGCRVPFGDHPLLGHIAIYSINLVLLRLVAGKTPFIFDESEIASHEDGTRPWDRLMNIWRSWFSLENLNGLTAVMVADRSEKKIKVAAKEKFRAKETTGKLQEFYNVALSLGDDVSACIAGFYLFDPTTESPRDLIRLEKMVQSEGLDLGMSAMLARLHVLSRNFDESPREFVEFAREAMEFSLRNSRWDQIESICQFMSRICERANTRHCWSTEGERVFQHVFEPSLMVEIAMRDPRSARILFGVGKRFHDSEWVFRFARQFLEVFIHEGPLFGTEKRIVNSENSAEWLLLFREIGRSGILFSYTNRINIFDRVIDPRHLLVLSERNPESALIYLQVLRELGGARYFEEFIDSKMGSKIIRRIFDSPYLLELSGGNPEGALSYLKVLRELGGSRYFEEFRYGRVGSKIIEQALNPHHLLEMGERNPEGALAYLQILREFGGARFFKEFLGRQMKLEDFFEHFFHPQQLLELSERNPEGALAYLQILRELGGSGYFEVFVAQRVTPGVIERAFDEHQLFDRRSRPMDSLNICLILARLCNSKKLVEKLGRTIGRRIQSGQLSEGLLSLLPIAAISDLRWLAKEAKVPELLEALDHLII